MKASILLVLVSSVLSLCIRETWSEKILVLAMISTPSHKITYMSLLEEMAHRGHEITIVSPIKPMKETRNIREIYTLDIEKAFEDLNIFEMKEKKQQLNPF